MPDQPRDDQRFWKVLALAALMLCAWLAVRGGPEAARADNGGASSDGIIAMMGINAAKERMYLIDVNKKSIAVYETDASDGIKFVSGRRYDQDIMAVEESPTRAVKYDNKGYDAQQIAAALLAKKK